jgi:hypothetical protein
MNKSLGVIESLNVFAGSVNSGKSFSYVSSFSFFPLLRFASSHAGKNMVASLQMHF